jgi:putative oxidoreductase
MKLTMRGIGGFEPGWGITILRISMGLVMAVHGYQKFAGGLPNVSAFFAKLSIPIPGLMGPFISVLELGGGILPLLGLATRWLGLLFALEHIVTTFWVKVPMQGWHSSELERMLLAGGIVLFLVGPGKLAIDEVWLEKEEA